jgi:DNA-binding response OmpR family regulator
MSEKILLLEDEESIRRFVKINLYRSGFEVVEAGTGEEALKIVKNQQDIMIAVLDVMLPGISGYEVCKQIRKDDPEMGIIMLTAKTQEMDKINGLVLGADDYVTKPFSPQELVARIQSLLRRVKFNKSRQHIKNQVIVFSPFE